jgi:hypothetical protein
MSDLKSQVLDVRENESMTEKIGGGGAAAMQVAAAAMMSKRLPAAHAAARHTLRCE